MTHSDAVPHVVITGVGGYGRLHLENARRLAAEGRLSIVGLVDPAVAAKRDRDGDIPLYADLDAALARHRADIVIVATPLDTHERLAEIAMRAGADVLLEKPPVPSMAAFERLLAVQRETGRAVQVGFQSLGSTAIAALQDDALDLGPMRSVSATGLWSRAKSYWERARWAGRRTLDGHAVVDGVVTNPLAHAVATALRIAGYDTAESVGLVETELYRVNAIEADDTSVIRVSGPGRPTVTCALTLCAPPELHDAPDRAATVAVRGTQASASFSYTTDVITADGNETSFGRSDLLENLIEHRRNGVDLIVPLVSTGAFMRVVEAVREAPEPTKIDPRLVTWHGEGAAEYPIIDGIVATVQAASEQGATFSELGVPWATPGADSVIATAHVDGVTVAREVDGGGTISFSSPHPYLHPVRTLGGVTVTATHPADHDWHTGVAFTVQDADGINFWGGRTYVHNRGYETLDDHGRIEVLSTDPTDDGVRHELAWRGPAGESVLEESRDIRWRALPFGDGRTAWSLEFDVHLTPSQGEVTLGSPGSKGRVGAGYGGFFWRLPDCVDVAVFTADAAGEDAVNGSVAPWLTFSADFLAGPEQNGTASIVLTGGDETTAGDPWFVRVKNYPGIGCAVAWDARTPVPADGLSRRYRAAVIDGAVSTSEANELAETLRRG
jgi:predicted dehydrogenase